VFYEISNFWINANDYNAEYWVDEWFLQNSSVYNLK
jgi:hypothetical protein